MAPNSSLVLKAEKSLCPKGLLWAKVSPECQDARPLLGRELTVSPGSSTGGGAGSGGSPSLCKKENVPPTHVHSRKI